MPKKRSPPVTSLWKLLVRLRVTHELELPHGVLSTRSSIVAQSA